MRACACMFSPLIIVPLPRPVVLNSDKFPSNALESGIRTESLTHLACCGSVVPTTVDVDSDDVADVDSAQLCCLSLSSRYCSRKTQERATRWPVSRVCKAWWERGCPPKSLVIGATLQSVEHPALEGTQRTSSGQAVVCAGEWVRYIDSSSQVRVARCS
jgi:hypothetical protein